MAEHSVLPPSSASVWGAYGACTGWVEMSRKFPDETGAAGEEGNRAHEVVAEFIKTMPHEPLNASSSNYDNDMILGAKLIRDSVFAVCREHKAFTPESEFRVDCPSVHEDSFGTADVVLYIPNAGLYIWDYKFGYGIVEAFENFF